MTVVAGASFYFLLFSIASAYQRTHTYYRDVLHLNISIPLFFSQASVTWTVFLRQTHAWR